MSIRLLQVRICLKREFAYALRAVRWILPSRYRDQLLMRAYTWHKGDARQLHDLYIAQLKTS